MSICLECGEAFSHCECHVRPAKPDCDCVANSAFKCFRVRHAVPEGETVTKRGGPCTCACHIQDED